MRPSPHHHTRTLGQNIYKCRALSHSSTFDTTSFSGFQSAYPALATHPLLLSGVVKQNGRERNLLFYSGLSVCFSLPSLAAQTFTCGRKRHFPSRARGREWGRWAAESPALGRAGKAARGASRVAAEVAQRRGEGEGHLQAGQACSSGIGDLPYHLKVGSLELQTA